MKERHQTRNKWRKREEEGKEKEIEEKSLPLLFVMCSKTWTFKDVLLPSLD
jgi:hypothetical protein